LALKQLRLRLRRRIGESPELAPSTRQKIESVCDGLVRDGSDIRSGGVEEHYALGWIQKIPICDAEQDASSRISSPHVSFVF